MASNNRKLTQNNQKTSKTTPGSGFEGSACWKSPMGPRGFLWVPRGCLGLPGAPQGTQGFPSAPWSSPEFPRVPQDSPGFPGLPRVPQGNLSSPGFPEFPRGSPGLPRGPWSSPRLPGACFKLLLLYFGRRPLMGQADHSEIQRSSSTADHQRQPHEACSFSCQGRQ